MAIIRIPPALLAAPSGAYRTVLVNGARSDVPVGVDTDQPAPITEVLTSAGISFITGGGNGQADDTIKITGSGSRVAVSVNGNVVYYPVEVAMPYSDVLLAALTAAGLEGRIVLGRRGAVPPAVGDILLEDGSSHLLLEDGITFLALE